ncbi:hypothetical protein [Algoriphagus sp. PAP.12]|uniref:hypothetical protein n=1 Tax=Algoriphagus sp. PAP.12 TaxID=2996678 RepID=UPI00227C837C|nr:hypothetical protein [Algoriphagus sp. PAP.12]
MEELQLLIEALEKGVKHNIYSKMEIYSIQKCVESVMETMKSINQTQNENTDS